MVSRCLLAVTASASLPAASCVSQGRYEAAVQDANAARAELAKTEQGLQRREKSAEEGRAMMQEQRDELSQDTQSLLAP